MKKDLLTLLDLEKKDFDALFRRAFELKARRKQGIRETGLAGKSLGLIFDKPSTRTRISFETAMIQMGGVPLFISTRDTQVSRNEPIMDTARVLSRYLDGIVIRTFSQDLLEEYAAFSDIPVINALTDLYHPTQVLSDLLTVVEKKGGYTDITIAWVGDGNNVAHSWLNAASILGFELRLACPKEYFPDAGIRRRAETDSRGNIMVMEDPREAVAEADVIYTDVWASMGQESESTARKQIFRDYQVNEDLVARAKPDVIVMHCLPAHRGEEITESLLESRGSVIWDQSENKLHMNKAILEAFMKGDLSCRTK